jgi:hypothetical protein
MDAGGIGSGLNWVGYHLTAYLAFQRVFIEPQRPVSSPTALRADLPGSCSSLAARYR